ncbi:hypothetical protein HC928_24115 [bacterium]|nr:hypothetical protein [bacterium]
MMRVGAKLVIPHHYDMFTFNTADPHIFAQHAQAATLPHRLLRVGERFVWPLP